MKKIKANIHSPEELLRGARSYLNSNDPQIMRAVVLESFTALETFVHKRVFDLLENKLDKLLVKWVENKTRNRLDDRLEILTPIALSKGPIDKASILWRDYKEAQKIRNDITHQGRKVTKPEAEKVVNTVYKWLAYLGSTVEVELSLLKLKNYLEKNKLEFRNESSIEKRIIEYFGNEEVLLKAQVWLPNRKVADVVLEFGGIKVLIEIKMLPDGRTLRSKKMNYLDQVLTMLEESRVERAAIIVVFKESIPEIFEKKVLTYHEGRISVVGIDMTLNNH